MNPSSLAVNKNYICKISKHKLTFIKCIERQDPLYVFVSEYAGLAYHFTAKQVNRRIIALNKLTITALDLLEGNL